jgi:hypothetical protein
MQSRIAIRALWLVSAALALSACGGGGGRNNSAAQAGTLQFNVATVTVAETAGTATLRVVRTGGSNGAVSVTVASSNGSAGAGTDYSAVTTTVSFAANDAAEKIVTVPIADDAQGEIDETLNVTLSAPTGGASLGANAAVTLTITDNDPPAAPLFSLEADSKQLRVTWTSVTAATSYRVLRDPDGAQGFSQVGTTHDAAATTATLDIALYRHDWVNARYRLDACNANGCRSSAVQSALPAMLDAIGYFKASNTEAGDLFGFAMALSADGRVLAVSSPGEDSNAIGIDGNQQNNGAEIAGAVYIFARAAGSWVQEAYVKASNTKENGGFGEALSLSADGRTLAVGAPTEASAATGVNGDQDNDDAPNAGAVYVFTRSADGWSQQAYVKASNTEIEDLFGMALALSADGNTLVVGAEGEASVARGVNGDQISNAAPISGAVYVFSRAADQWSQQAYLKASNTAQNDSFGAALALSADGDTLAVGAAGEDSAAQGVNGDESNEAALGAGAAYVFSRTAGLWQQQAYLKTSNSEALDFFGHALALNADGNTLAVTAVGESSSATGVNGDQRDNAALRAGAVYVFTRAGKTWSQQAYMKPSNTGAGDFFGTSLSLSADGNTLAIAAPGEASAADGIAGDQNDESVVNAGAVYVFVRSASQQWQQLAYAKAANSAEEDLFGSQVALSADGDTLAVGAPGEDGSATGIGGDASDNAQPVSGAIYLY